MVYSCDGIIANKNMFLKGCLMTQKYSYNITLNKKTKQQQKKTLH